ncbi:hypothetical protein ACVGWJ_00565, partial [Enterobacter hormaechei]
PRVFLLIRRPRISTHDIFGRQRNFLIIESKMSFIKAFDFPESFPYVLQAPENVNGAEVFIMPPEQPW